MCTVTLLPLNTGAKSFVLTSNRDEGVQRKAVPPDFYDENGVKMLYPKDLESGGSWIGISEHSRLICLLNGGFEAHVRKDFYRLSRGVVLKDLLAAGNFKQAIKAYNLMEIEPFTIIAVDWKEHLQFFELVWDGQQKHVKELSHKPHIWSSSPLYNREMVQLRESWFSAFLEKKNSSSKALWEFHHRAGTGDKNMDVIMDRGFIKTQSITQIENTGEKVRMRYEDLEEENCYETPFII